MRMYRACLPIVLLSSIALAQSRTTITTMPATTRTTTRPATTTTSKPATVVTPAGRQLLDRVKQAYAGPTPLTLEGVITGTFDVAGRKAERRLEVVGYADGQGRFSHEAKGVGKVVHAGDRIFVYDSRQNAYGKITAPEKRQAADDVSNDLIDILIDENPALLLTLTTAPDQLLVDQASAIDAVGDDLILKSDDQVQTFRLDSEGLIRSVVIDYTPLLKRKGATEIKSAKVELTYNSVQRQAAPEGTFAFAIPDGASEFQLSEELMKERREAMLRRIPSATRPTTGPTTRPISDAK